MENRTTVAFCDDPEGEKSNRKKTVPSKTNFSTRKGGERIAINKSTVSDLMAEGRLPFVKIGHRRLIAVRDLMRFLEDSRQRQ